MPDHAHHRLVADRGEAPFQPFEDLRVEIAPEGRQRDADQRVGGLRAERGGDAIGHVTEAARHLEHPHARLGRHAASLAQHARDRHPRDVRLGGDVGQRDAAEAAGGVPALVVPTPDVRTSGVRVFDVRVSGSLSEIGRIH